MHSTEEKFEGALAVDWRENFFDWCRSRRSGDPQHPIRTAARSSPLSRAQVEEIRNFFSDIHFEITWVQSTGDLDQKTSLRTLDKTDFFTRELDQMLLSGSVDLAIHSAKDLPDPIPNGLKILSITPCIDSRDCLVLREALRPGMCIATSSERREEIVKSLCPNLKFVDLRGTIEERLAKIGQEVDGIVVAEAALVRLKLNPNRIYLPGTTTPLQGCLAMLVRDE